MFKRKKDNNIVNDSVMNIKLDMENLIGGWAARHSSTIGMWFNFFPNHIYIWRILFYRKHTNQCYKRKLGKTQESFGKGKSLSNKFVNIAVY